MIRKTPEPVAWTLRGSPDAESITRRQGLLGAMFENARSKGNELAQLRQTNLNFSLLIFAALFTFSFQFTKGWYSVAGSAALCFTMSVFCLMDRKFHKFMHGWRETEIHLTERMTNLLNQPEDDLKFRRHMVEAQETAQLTGLQPMITYALVLASTIHLAYSLWRILTLSP